jgi:hypothetical protein
MYISENRIRAWGSRLKHLVRATTTTHSEAKRDGEKVRGKNGKGKDSGGLSSAIRLHR